VFHKEIFGKTIKYFDTSLISLILSIVTIPSLWHISNGNPLWVFSCTILWWIGSFLIFHPSIRFLFPFLLTKISAFALTFILAIGTILLNTTVITTLLPVDDLEIVMNSGIFSTSIGTIALFIWFYVTIAGVAVANINLSINYILYRQKRLMRQIFNLSEYYIETLFLFIIPIALLFWVDITYSFRVFLGLISITVGMSIFIPKITIRKIEQKILLSTISLLAVVLIDGAVGNLINMNSTPTTTTIQVKSGEKQIFQLSDNIHNNNITVYQILLSIPQIGLHLGHKVATVYNRNITIEKSKSQYTIQDELNGKVLMTLDR